MARSPEQHRPGDRPADRRRGAIFVEFALVLLVLYIVLFGALELGRAVFGAQLVQDAARVAARELALVALPPQATFEEALADPEVLARIYNDDYLVIDLDAVGDLDSFFATLPLVNQMLRPLMIVDAGEPAAASAMERAGGGQNLLRYPGALLADPGSLTGYTVQIPRVVARGDDGVETIEWVPVLEEIKPDGAAHGPFGILPVAGGNPNRGVVALRVNYPFQAAALSGFQANPDDERGKNMKLMIEAQDGAVSQLNAPLGGASLLGDDSPAGVYAGPFGLGRQQALLKTLRPFRKLISGQAVFRREVFAPVPFPSEVDPIEPTER